MEGSFAPLDALTDPVTRIIRLCSEGSPASGITWTIHGLTPVFFFFFKSPSIIT